MSVPLTAMERLRALEEQMQDMLTRIRELGVHIEELEQKQFATVNGGILDATGVRMELRK